MSGKNIPKGCERNWSHKGKHMVENQKILHWVPAPKLTEYSDARWGETALRQSGCSLYEMETISYPCSTFYHNNHMRNHSSPSHKESGHPPSLVAQGRFSPPLVSLFSAQKGSLPDVPAQRWALPGTAVDLEGTHGHTSKNTCSTLWLGGSGGENAYLSTVGKKCKV